MDPEKRSTTPTMSPTEIRERFQLHFGGCAADE